MDTLTKEIDLKKDDWVIAKFYCESYFPVCYRGKQDVGLKVFADLDTAQAVADDLNAEYANCLGETGFTALGEWIYIWHPMRIETDGVLPDGEEEQ